MTSWRNFLSAWDGLHCRFCCYCLPSTSSSFAGRCAHCCKRRNRRKSIGPTRTDVRLPVDTMPTEIRHLLQAVNQALDRLEQGFRVQREFTADAAHELRTPLAVLRTRLDTLTDRRTTEALRHDVEGMCRMVGQLIDITELDTYIVAPSEMAELRSVCAEVVELVAPLAMSQGKEICLDAVDEPVWVKGNPDMMYRAVRNLVENAIYHTPRGTVVELQVRSDGSIIGSLIKVLASTRTSASFCFVAFGVVIAVKRVAQASALQSCAALPTHTWRALQLKTVKLAVPAFRSGSAAPLRALWRSIAGLDL